jgi:dTDP-4-amino-4,6-dideoxygalactose transaminase
MQRVVDSGRYVLGDEVVAFERRFSGYIGVSHCVGVGSGLDALHLTLRALGISSGDEVIVPGHTFIATWLAVVHAGARPVPVDIDPLTYNLDVARVAGAINTQTRAIVAVHLYGQPVDMDPLLAIADQHGLPVVEDASQAHGALYNGRHVGSLGVAGTWSFYPSKNLGGIGDGGAVTTDDAALAERVRVLRSYGATEKDGFEVAGFNSRLDELQAATLRVKLDRLDSRNARRRALAAMYQDSLRDSQYGLPSVPPWAEVVWHQFVIRSARRDELRRHLEQRQIATAIHYPVPPHQQPLFAQYAGCALPRTAAAAREILSLPIGPHLSDDTVGYVIDALQDFDHSR